MATGFYTEYGGQGTQDLENVFAPGTSFDGSNYTGFWSEYRNQDLANIFAPRSSGADIGYNTGFIALDGRDLREWFAANGTVIVNHNAIFFITVAYLGERIPGSPKYGWENGVGGGISYQGGSSDPGMEWIYEVVDSANPDPLSFVRFLGGGRPWGMSDAARLYFKSRRNNTGQEWFGFMNYASGAGEYQTIDDNGFSQGVGEVFTFEIRDYPF